MNQWVEPISPGQFYWLLVVSMVASGVYVWPQYIVSRAGSDATLSLALATALSCGNLWVQCRWAGSLNVTCLLDGLQATWGGVGAVAIWAMDTALLVALDGVLAALYGDLLQTFFYPRTPRLVMISVVVAMACFIGSRSWAVVARNAQFWVPICLLGLVFAMLTALSNAAHPAALLPRFPLPWTGTLEGTVGSWFLFVNGGLAAGLSTSVRWRRRPRMGPLVLVGALTVGALLLGLLGLVLATLGPSATATLAWPIVYLFDLVTFPNFIVPGLALIVVLVWTVAMVLALAVHLAHISQNATVLVRAPRAAYVAALGVVLVVVSVAVPSVTEARRVLFGGIDPVYLGFVLLVVPPTFVVGLARARRRALR